MHLGLEGKLALVTGGTDGIGLAAAQGLAAHGAHVAIAARGMEGLEHAVRRIEETSAERCRVVPVAADVSRAQDIERLHATVRDELGPVDILVNNAGTSSRGDFTSLADDDWEHDIDLKLMAGVRLARLTIPEMRQRGGGRIVNVTAIGGKHPAAHSAPTTVSRAAGIALTKVLSKEFAKDNVLVNAVCIGVIESGQHDRRWREEAPSMTREAFYERLATERGIPLGRVGRPEEAANLIVFLASEAASYLTGAAINLDGGLSSLV